MQWQYFAFLWSLLLLSSGSNGDVETCDRRPLASKTTPLRPDNRFAIDIVDVGEKYIPDREYKIKLYAVDNKATFIAFTIFLQGDTEYNAFNPRKPTLLESGRLGLDRDSDDVIYKQSCKNVLIQSNLTPKTSIEASWTAPKKNQKCITIFAAVAVKQDVWFIAEGPLSKKVCEDLRKAEDMPPIENDNCQECRDARYLLTFEGTWSFNTHPTMFPNNTGLARFSDVVGAAHDMNFNVFKSNSEASDGLKMLAEQGNTTMLELEIQDKLPNNVRTVIKATGQPRPNMTTTAMFRVSPNHHLVSLVSAVIPSPDWFLGVANYELCDVITQKWIEHGLLNLYPMDAGTDSGATFEAANEATFPPQSIAMAAFIRDVPKETLKPFARLKFDLIRTYDRRGQCEEQAGEERKRLEETTTEAIEEVTEPSSVAPDVDSSEDCPMTTWSDWYPCDGECVDGKISGIRFRERYHLVNGVPIEKYGVKVDPGVEVSRYCKEKETDFEEEPCEDDCDAVEADFRLYMFKNHNWILEGYYSLGENIGGHNTRQVDLSVWSNEGKL